MVREEYVNICRKYIELCPPGMRERSVFIINKNRVSRKAVILSLPHQSEYTGQSLRRCSAIHLVDGIDDVTYLKRHGGWKATTVAQC